jgi:hypothetical protein
MKIIRTVNEAEVIGEFLRNEFYQNEYHHDRHDFEHIVMEPDYSNAGENAVRRALLFRRRGHMWRELPADTKWYDVELESSDLPKVHVFPRAQWRKLSNGSFCITEIVKSVRNGGHKNAGNDVIAKIQQLRYRLQANHETASAVMLIGVDESKALTVLEGNHRLTAALLVSPDAMQSRFRVLCGFSPHMTESCWYRTDVPNLFRYLKNRILHLYDREADVERLTIPVPKRPSTVTENLVNAATNEGVTVTKQTN